MKKNLLFLAMLMITFMAQTQIVKEHDYTGSTNLVNLAISGEKYYNMDWANNKCRLYNLDHSLWKTINLAVPSGMYLYDIRQVSETLFNLDTKLELAYIYYAYDTVLYYYTYATRVINENGLELLMIPGASYTEVKTTTSDGTKLLAWVYDYSVIPYTVNTMVYSLPGQQGPTGSNQAGTDDKADPAFPNPGHDMVTIPYVIPDGVNSGTISITDVNGRFIRNYAIGSAFSTLQVSTAGWPRGIYYYRIEAAGQVSTAKKIIID